MAQNERRRVNRVGLCVLAQLGGTSVELMNLSLSGARIESAHRLPPGSETTLSFSARGTVVRINVRVERCRMSRAERSGAIYDIGLSFPVLQRSIAEVVANELAETLRQQKANAAGVVPLDGPSFGEQLAQVRPSGKYLQLTLEGNVWRTATVDTPRQPQNGFTVDAGERPDQIALLQRTYERGDYNARNMIARLASMTISVAAVVEARNGTAA
jgi:hypothetical protein